MMAGTRGRSYQGWINHQCHNRASDWLMVVIQASDWPIVSQHNSCGGQYAHGGRENVCLFGCSMFLLTSQGFLPPGIDI